MRTGRCRIRVRTGPSARVAGREYFLARPNGHGLASIPSATRLSLPSLLRARSPAVDVAAGTEPVRVAALYVDPNGSYAGVDGVDLWDEARDARLYAGPWPVVAHPPCNRWAKLGPRERRGQDGGCFAAALAAVRAYGGVLEHPAESNAWRAFGLLRPKGTYWRKSLLDVGWVSAVDQWHYGFPTRKPTWLYRVDGEYRAGDIAPAPLKGGLVHATRGCDALWSTERAHTPPEFRDVLLAMDRTAGRVPA